MAGSGSPAELLIGLARSRSPEARERLMQALALVCDTPEANSPRAERLIGDILMVLVRQAEQDIRARLAQRLAPARWAPSALVNTLALEDIEIARPIIARSPVLTEPDLVRLLVTATVEHQIEVARRPHIGQAVVRTILERKEPSVLTALAGNETAALTERDLAVLVASARQIASLRAPLARHPRLNADLALSLYAWVGEVLRRELSERFPGNDEQLKAAIDEAVGGAADGPPLILTEQGDPDRAEMEAKLIAKLQAAGQLRPGYLLKSLREGKLYLFEVALAALAHLRTEEVRLACGSDRPELLALACAAVGIDRSVFPTILSLLRALNHGRPSGSEGSLQAINRAFSLKNPDEARAAFRIDIRELEPQVIPFRDKARP